MNCATGMMTAAVILAGTMVNGCGKKDDSASMPTRSTYVAPVAKIPPAAPAVQPGARSSGEPTKPGLLTADQLKRAPGSGGVHVVTPDQMDPKKLDDALKAALKQ